MNHHVMPGGECDSSDIFGDGTYGSTIMSWYWCLLHCKAALSSPVREDPQPDSFTAVGWADCPGLSRKKHQTTGQRVSCILT